MPDTPTSLKAKSDDNGIPPVEERVRQTVTRPQIAGRARRPWTETSTPWRLAEPDDGRRAACFQGHSADLARSELRARTQWARTQRRAADAALSGKDLPRANLTNVNLPGTNPASADLEDVNLGWV